MSNQQALIVAYMTRHGSITPMEAFEKLGITKLSTRISELLKCGEKISKTMTDGKNRFGEDVKYMTYRIGK